MWSTFGSDHLRVLRAVRCRIEDHGDGQARPFISLWMNLIACDKVSMVSKSSPSDASNSWCFFWCGAAPPCATGSPDPHAARRERAPDETVVVPSHPRRVSLTPVTCTCPACGSQFRVFKKKKKKTSECHYTTLPNTEGQVTNNSGNSTPATSDFKNSFSSKTNSPVSKEARWNISPEQIDCQ